ncbi:MAG: alpha/beta fold hydrolase [Actinomycetes bacterium]
MHIEVDGLRLFVDVLSPEYVPVGPSMVRRPTVVCLHGSMNGDYSNVWTLANRLTDAACVIVTDRRGNGRSDGGGPDTWRLDRFADDVYELCQAMGVWHPIVLGTSYGGFIAQAYAARYPDHPSGLALVSTAARFDVEALAKNRDRLDEPRSPAVVEALQHRDARAIRRRPVDAYPEHAFLLDVDLREQNAAIKCPVLVVSGTDDPIDQSKRAEELGESIGSGDVHVVRIPDAGHLLDIDAPEETARLLHEFIDRIGAPADPWGPGRTPYDANA